MLMGNSDLDPWGNVRQWQGHVFKSTSLTAHNFPIVKGQIIHSSVLPSHINSSKKATAGTTPSWFGVSNFTGLNPTFSVPFNFIDDAQAGAATHKRFLIFDQSGDHTRLIFSSLHPPLWNAKSIEHQSKSAWHPNGHCTNIHSNCIPVNQSEKTEVSDGSKEMPEDSDEIDALLYSDSEHEDEEFSTDYVPVKTLENNEEVASSGIPSKRRRLNEDNNMLLTDTANSARVHSIPYTHYNDGDDTGGSTCVKEARGDAFSEGDISRSSNHGNCNKRKRVRDHILKTVGMLRRIIPGGKGKDAAMILDKAIQYLRSLKLKAKVPGAAQ